MEDCPDKTGSLSRVVGQRTRRNGVWSTKMALRGAGSAGTPPDNDQFLSALMGQDGVSGGGGWQYLCEDLDPSLTIWDQARPSTMNQRCAPGAIVASMAVNFGQTFADVTFRGECKCVLGSDTFAVESDQAKSGLVSYPDMPATPTVVGASLASVITGYKGTITLDGDEYTTIREGSFEISVERELQKMSWNEDLPTGIMSGVRSARISRLAVDDDDSANLKSLIARAYGSTEVDFTLQLGIVAGGIYVFSFKNIVLPKPEYDYSGKRRGLVFANMTGAATTLTSKDEIAIVVK